MTETIPPGSRLGPYEIQGLLGAGGMGEVYRARDARLGRDVAVKILPSSFAADAERLRRFEREARSAAQLSHPNIVAIHDVGVAGAVPYLVSELIEGTTLRARVAQSPLAPRKAIAFAIQIANGLAAAHARGIVHRDLKPENLMVLKGDRLKIVDFGLAKLVSAEAGAAARGEDDTASIAPQLTETGAILGTASYMAPEQIRQQPVDHRADLFAVGAILYEMLTGRRAFDGPTPMDRLSAILNATPAPLGPEIEAEAPGVTALVDRCLDKDVDARFQNAHDLAFTLGLIDEAAARATRSPAGHDRAHAGRASIPASAPDVEYQRMTYREGSIQTARFAPDGQTICYGSAWEGRPMELFWAYPGNPEPRPLGNPGTDVLSISKTGEMAVSLRRRARGGFVFTGMLARMPAGGGAAREILDGVPEADWSPDGRQLAILREESGLHQIEYPMGTVIHRSPSWISHMRISPDGAKIAFLEHPVRGNDAGGPAVVDIKSGAVKTLSTGWASARGLAWAPNGEIVFTAFRTGAGRALQGVTVEGRERLVHKAPGHMTLADISRQGTVLVNFENERMRTDYRGKDGKPSEMSWLDWTLLRALSADGNWALLEESGVGAGELHAVYLRGTDGSPAIRLGDGHAFDLSPDGQWALGGLGQGPTVLTLLPCGAGEMRIVPTEGLDVNSARWFPNGKEACLVAHEKGHGLRLHHLDAATGEIRPFGDEGLSWHEIMVSPDGTRVAAFGPDRTMKIYSLDDAPPRTVPEISLMDRPVGWSPDGEGLLVFGRGEVPGKVFRVGLDGTRTLVKELAPLDPTGIEGLTGVKMASDGQWAYSYIQRLSTLYVIEGLFQGA